LSAFGLAVLVSSYPNAYANGLGPASAAPLPAPVMSCNDLWCRRASSAPPRPSCCVGWWRSTVHWCRLASGTAPWTGRQTWQWAHERAGKLSGRWLRQSDAESFLYRDRRRRGRPCLLWPSHPISAWVSL